ncbi:MAG: nucleotidyl transferase AbiEii/AbiGii toxin family protein [Planctomycetota bacterium]
MLLDPPVTFREIMSNEPFPLAVVQPAVVEFLHGRHDAVLFGAQAVNVYVDVTRATEDVDILTTRGKDFAEEIRAFLNDRFGFAVRVRSVRGGIGFRIYQKRKEGNRHLVDVRPVETFPPVRNVGGVSVVAPAELIANKVASAHARGDRKKGLTDRRDLLAMLEKFPELKADDGEVVARLIANGASEEALAAWREWVATEIEPEGEDDDMDW